MEVYVADGFFDEEGPDLPPFYVPVLMRGQCPCWASSKEGDAEGIAVAPQNNFANSFGVRLPRLL